MLYNYNDYMINEDQFNIFRMSCEDVYKEIVEVSCAYFQGEKVYFNSKGLEHLKFKSKNHARAIGGQYTRLRLLHLAPKVLKLTRTVQGISHRKVIEIIRSNQRSEHRLVNVVFYEFIAILESVRVRVIVKQVENGPKYFWSIIPNWKTGSDKIRMMHYGNPETD